MAAKAVTYIGPAKFEKAVKAIKAVMAVIM
jgi:hypothetical protein